MGLFRGLLTLAVFGLFIGITLWAYSKNRRTTFDALAAMPLADDSVAPTESHCEENAR